MEDTKYKIALFPIPGSVSFPHTTVPLHIFEPRYRILFQEAQRQSLRVGVCHTKKVIRQAKQDLTPNKKLNSNLSSFEPHNIFSAGFPEIMDITDDGRMLVEIKMEERFLCHRRLQDVPFLISECTKYRDENNLNDQGSTKSIRANIDQYLTQFAKSDHPQLFKLLNDLDWKKATDDEYSFKIFQTVKLQPNLMQEILEMRTTNARLSALASQLRL